MKRVLVIDDEVAVLRHFMVLLTQGRRYEITVLSDSTKALEMVRAGKFDIVLLDMAMPGVHGREVLRGIREHHPEIAVIVITGVEDDQLAVEAMQLGAFDYLYKPVGEDQLMLTLDRALEECASGREAV
jgi:DNA-binding NtrC family response regulator